MRAQQESRRQAEQQAQLLAQQEALRQSRESVAREAEEQRLRQQQAFIEAQRKREEEEQALRVAVGAADPLDEADVVAQQRDHAVHPLLLVDPALAHMLAAEDFLTDERDLDRVFDVVVQRVAVGDVLTTSTTPGYARTANGPILAPYTLGTATSALASGSGTVGIKVGMVSGP